MASKLVRSRVFNTGTVVRFHRNRRPFKSETKSQTYRVVTRSKGRSAILRSLRTGRCYSVPFNTRLFPAAS